MPANLPEAPVNLTLLLRDNESSNEVTAKIHIYGESPEKVLRSAYVSMRSLLIDLGVIPDDRQGSGSRPGEDGLSSEVGQP